MRFFYRCEECGGQFESSRSPEEAVRESKKIFGEIPEPMQAVVCDPCFKAIMKGEA